MYSLEMLHGFTALFKTIGRPSKNTRTTESEFEFSLEPSDQYSVLSLYSGAHHSTIHRHIEMAEEIALRMSLEFDEKSPNIQESTPGWS